MKIKYKLKIERDEFSESPDQWRDNNLFLVYDHRQFDVRRDGFHPRDIFNHLNAKNKVEKSETTFNGKYTVEEYSDDLNPIYENYWIFNVDAYIHSGVVLSLANNRDFPDRQWDISTTGYILVTKEFNPSNKDIPCNEEEAENYAEGLIETWNKYLSGEVYGYQIIKETTCGCCNNVKEDSLDSCWGFYGEEECKEQGQFALDGFNKHLEV